MQDSRTKGVLIRARGNSDILVSAYACDVGLRLAQYEPAEPYASRHAGDPTSIAAECYTAVQWLTVSIC